MSWKSRIKTLPEDGNNKSSTWRDRIQNEVSELESGLRGTAQGLSMNLADEITGGLEALKEVALTDKNLSDYADLYTKHRDESRQAYKEAEETNPKSYLAGNIAGGIGGALVMPGSAASLVGRAGQAAGIGAVMGYGANENRDELLQDMALNAGIGAVSVPVLEGAGSLIKKGLSKAADYADDVLPKVGKGFFSVPEKATQNYLQNPDRVNKARSWGELGESVLNTSDDTSVLSEMNQRSKELSTKAWETLKPNQSIPKADILRAIDDGQQALMVDGNSIGGAQKKAFNTLKSYAEDLTPFNNDIPEPSLKKIIQNLDENIDWNNKSAGPTNDVLKQLRTFIDQRLKTQNPDYESAMSKTEDVTKALGQVKKALEKRTNPESYDKFTKVVKGLINKDEMSDVNQAVNKIKEHTGYDLRSDIVDSWTKQQFEKGDVNGSRRTLLGSVVGGAVGSMFGPLGSAIGAAALGSTGYTVDKYAGLIFKKMLDGRMTMGEFNEQLAPRLGKFAKPLAEALNRGPTSVSATHFLLNQNPEYRKLINGEQD